MGDVAGKVDAIKKLRELGRQKATVMHAENGTITIIPSPMATLRDCKDLVEAIMRLGVRDYLSDTEDNFRRFTGDPFTGEKTNG